MSRPYVPAGQPAVAPFFLGQDAQRFIEFLIQAFEAEELSRMARPDGVIMHAAMSIDGSLVMLGTREKTSQNSTHLYVKDVDETFRRCLSLGSEAISEPKTFPYGDRSAGVRDPFGNVWWIGTHLGA